MKRILSILIATALLFSMSACKKEEEKSNFENETALEKTETNDFYEKMNSSSSRPVAIMIDNDSDIARPQTGLENAFVIYEMMVEGAATRMMALFLDSDLEKVGPVRSSRHYFLDYVLENDALYAHCGYSPQAASDINILGVNSLNEISSNNGKNYFRDNAKSAPHNLFTNIPELLSYAKSIGFKLETDKNRVFTFKADDEDISGGETANKIVLPYSYAYTVAYEYNSEKGKYDRYINGDKHMSESSGDVLSAENILIYKVTNYSIDSVGRQNLENIGSGTGIYISNGKSIPITWSKNSRSEQTVYKTENGEQLVLNPGNTFVQIMPQTSNIIIE